MKTLWAFKVILVFSLLSLIGNVDACNTCRTRVIASYPTVYYYATPVVYQTYAVCPCSGVWGSPSCNCEPIPVPTSCTSCGVEQSYYVVPGHWHGTEYEVYYNKPDVYPTPAQFYDTDVGYTLDDN